MNKLHKHSDALAAKALLQEINSPLNAASFLAGLALSGLAEQCEYLSTTGSGEKKHFLQLTESGLAYGINQSNPMHKFKTEPRFWSESFPQLHLHVAKGIYDFAQREVTPAEMDVSGDEEDKRTRIGNK